MLKDEERESLIKEEIQMDYFKQMKVENSNNPKQTLEILLKDILIKKQHYQVVLRQGGEDFFMATALSTIGIFLLYIGFILTKTPFSQELSTLINMKWFSDANLINFYYSLIFLILIYGFLNFIRGIITILRVLYAKFDEELIR